MAKFHVIVPAAGVGARMASAVPKQYLLLLGKPVLAHAIAACLQHPRISSVTVVLDAGDAYWPSAGISHSDKLRVLYSGGATRADTVYNGLLALDAELYAEDWVLVHDAARPGLTITLLDRLLDSLQDDVVGGLLAIPVADTLKRADGAQRVLNTEPREHLWQAQTPQMFRYAILRQALAAVRLNGTPTDEAQAVEALGYSPKLVAGELRNLKITYPQDLPLAAAILQADQQA